MLNITSFPQLPPIGAFCMYKAFLEVLKLSSEPRTRKKKSLPHSSGGSDLLRRSQCAESGAARTPCTMSFSQGQIREWSCACVRKPEKWPLCPGLGSVLCASSSWVVCCSSDDLSFAIGILEVELDFPRKDHNPPGQLIAVVFCICI